ncbi:MAG TPA: TonB family protein [Bryobacteraceae bacterium]|nr:TonB family protein [Bryobacteraceae bacterium]
MSIMVLIDAGLKVTALFAAAALLDRLLGRASAATRHVVWVAALAGAMALAPLSLTIPAWQLPLWPATAPDLPGVMFGVDATARDIAVPVTKPAAIPAPGAAIPWIALFWAVGSVLVASRMLVGSWAVRRIASRGSAPPEPMASRVAQLAGECGVSTEVLLIPGGAMPMTFGVLRPRILLPKEAVSWTPDRLDAVVLHELAHVRRRDTFWHGIANLACALYWPHPLAWRALHRALAMRECAADDFVLARGARPSDYARNLLEIARSLAAPRLCGSAAMARPSQLEGRLVAILDGKASRSAASRRFSLGAAVSSLAIALVLAGFHPVRAQDDAAVSQADAALASYNFDRAVALYGDLLADAERKYGPGSAQFARVLVKTGVALAASGQSAMAAQSFARAAAILSATAPDDPALAEALYRSGVHAQVARDNDTARDLYTRALAVARKAGSDALAARVLHNMALLAADPAEKERHIQEAIETASRLDNPGLLAASLEVYGRLLRETGRGAEADQAEERARLSRPAIPGRNAAATRPPLPEGVYRVGDGVNPPKLLLKTEPQYSDEARAAKVQGAVVLYAEIGPDGMARNVQVIRPLGLGLEEQAVRAVQQWRFAPGTRDGAPVTVAATIEVNFRLF